MNKKAVIDIGTNSVKLLIAEVKDGTVDPLLETGTQTRLGRGLKNANRLEPQAINDTIAGIQKFIEKTKPFKVQSLGMIATSAVRDAENGSLFLQEIMRSTGFHAQVLTGEEEAGFAFEGVMSTPGLEVEGPCTVVDLGGGSTEFVVRREKKPLFVRSYPLGTVRQFEMFDWSDPPSQEDWLKLNVSVSELLSSRTIKDIEALLGSDFLSHMTLIGTGGTLTVLARMFLEMDSYERNKLEGTTIPLANMVQLREKLWSMDQSTRKRVKGLPPERADIMPAGVGIFECVLKALKCDSIQVSTRGLRFGYLLHS